jgi:hypothetical protein
MWADGVHKGVDLLTPTGTDVVAPWSGTVVEVGRTSWGSAVGTAVIIDFDRLPNGDPGLWGILAHLSSVTVKPGARVAVGARVGRSGATGNVSGPHLHFEVQRDRSWRADRHVNPQPWLDATPTRGATPMGQYEYSGKPTGVLKVPAGAGWVMLDADVPDPTSSALEFQNAYLHCDCEWADRARCGEIRVKYVREGGDATAYQDYTVAPGKEDFLITALHFEKGERGRGGRWHIDVGGGLSGVTITTRYDKLATAT